MNDNASRGRGSEGARRTPFDVLGDQLAEADRLLLAAKDAEQHRTAMLLAVRATLDFYRGAKPPIRSLALISLFEKLAGLFVGPREDVFQRNAGHGLTASDAQRARDTMIAVAVKVLSEGGKPKGNMTRDEAGRLVASELNKLKIKDRESVFNGRRVTNIFLDVSKSRKSRSGSVSPASPRNAVTAVMRDRTQNLPNEQYRSIIAACIRCIPGSLKTIADRKRVAMSFIRAAANMSVS